MPLVTTSNKEHNQLGHCRPVLLDIELNSLAYSPTYTARQTLCLAETISNHARPWSGMHPAERRNHKRAAGRFADPCIVNYIVPELHAVTNHSNEEEARCDLCREFQTTYPCSRTLSSTSLALLRLFDAINKLESIANPATATRKIQIALNELTYTSAISARSPLLT
jgi:hypothetical protein